ncbi:hypothetical protein FNF31_02835 [Cafeteria roenbergensis]|uniref:Haloacid dehalogenase, type II n=1 Tax=Cafeteria roenbergensis TaxID=33653 RepID=A0A5A8DI31_CAFRO|nr:hypothetical protein FNF31_02835 [Cafeteria roenbergensis]
MAAARAAARDGVEALVRQSKVIVFDAYGTLFDVQAAARGAGLGPLWPKVAEVWRTQQLQATWLRNCLPGGPAFVPFWTVTQEALEVALAAAGVDGSAPATGGEAGGVTIRERLLQLYKELEAYDDVADVLSKAQAAGRRTAILSNGSKDMLGDAIRAASLEDKLDAVISADDAAVFKPDSRVYDLVCSSLGVRPEEVLFVSSNNWDVKGAAAYGFATAWCNRKGSAGDAIPGSPDVVIESLVELAEACAAQAAKPE